MANNCFKHDHHAVIIPNKMNNDFLLSYNRQSVVKFSPLSQKCHLTVGLSEFGC